MSHRTSLELRVIEDVMTPISLAGGVFRYVQFERNNVKELMGILPNSSVRIVDGSISPILVLESNLIDTGRIYEGEYLGSLYTGSVHRYFQLTRDEFSAITRREQLQ